MKHICLAITGASGAAYAWRLLQQLQAHSCEVSLLLSQAAQVVIKQELGHSLPADVAQQQQWLNKHFDTRPELLRVYSKLDWFAPVASGSAPLDAMVICPASGGTLSAIAQGASNNLIERAADVCLKERRKLLVVPRETPYSQIYLENLLKLTQMGVIVMPASPGFYHQPKSIDDLIDFMVARICDHLGLPQTLMSPWGAEP